MNRFLFFASQTYYPEVAFTNFVGHFESISDVLAQMPTQSSEMDDRYDNVQIVDTSVRVMFNGKRKLIERHRTPEGDLVKAHYSKTEYEWEFDLLNCEPALLYTHSKHGGFYVQEMDADFKIDELSSVPVIVCRDLLKNEVLVDSPDEWSKGKMVLLDPGNTAQHCITFYSGAPDLQQSIFEWLNFQDTEERD